MGITSCSKDVVELENVSDVVQTKSIATTEEFEMLKESLKDSAVITIDSEESLRKLMVQKTAEYYQNRTYCEDQGIKSNLLSPRISITSYEATGFDTKEVIESFVMRFSGEMPDLIGVEAYTDYVVQFANYTKDVQRALNTNFMADEDCMTVAWIPLANPREGNLYTNQYGYANMKKSESIQTLETQCLIVAYDILGRVVDKYYPTRRPENYLWTYYCIDLSGM